jgi:hypothetical protein
MFLTRIHAREESLVRARDDFGRAQMRRVDALRFKLQREINLKEDEIQRLQTELVFARGRAETISDKITYSQGALKNRSEMVIKSASGKD